MKHRSVIAFVIVAAALFAAPQLSHDLEALRGAVGARLRGEILHAFLSLPAAEGAATAAPRRARTMLASCIKEKADAQAAKTRKAEPAGSPRAEARSAEGAPGQLAAVVERAGESLALASELVEVPHAFAFVEAAEMPRRAPEAEVAMIIPPDSGIDPRGLARLTESAVREGGRQARRAAQEVRHTYVMARVERNGEMQKSGEVLRGLEESLPAGFEYRIEGDASKAKVVKFKRAACARCPVTPAPVAPRAPSLFAAGATLPSVGAAAEAASE